MKVHYLFSKDFLSTYVKYIQPISLGSYGWFKNAETGEWDRIDRGREIPMFFQNKPGGNNYTIFEEGKTEPMTSEVVALAANTWDSAENETNRNWRRDLGLEPGDLPVHWPELKKVIFISHYAGCKWEEKFVNMSRIQNGRDMWMEMQNTIARSQRESALEQMKNSYRLPGSWL